MPDAEVVEAGEALFDLFREHAEAVEPGSVEEAFLGLGATTWASAVEVGRSLRTRAAEELGLPVSVGIGSTKLMAKLASRAAKPDGLHLIDAAEELELRRALPIDRVWGVGAKTQARLAALDVTRLEHLDRVSDPVLLDRCGTAMARRLRRIRQGSDDATVRPVAQRSSLSAEAATSGWHRPDSTPQELVAQCCLRLCRRATREGLVATGISVRLTAAADRSTRVISREGMVPHANAEQWCDEVGTLLAGMFLPPLERVRVTLTGLRVTESPGRT